MAINWDVRWYKIKHWWLCLTVTSKKRSLKRAHERHAARSVQGTPGISVNAVRVTCADDHAMVREKRV